MFRVDSLGQQRDQNCAVQEQQNTLAPSETLAPNPEML